MPNMQLPENSVGCPRCKHNKVFQIEVLGNLAWLENSKPAWRGHLHRWSPPVRVNQTRLVTLLPCNHWKHSSLSECQFQDSYWILKYVSCRSGHCARRKPKQLPAAVHGQFCSCRGPIDRSKCGFLIIRRDHCCQSRYVGWYTCPFPSFWWLIGQVSCAKLPILFLSSCWHKLAIWPMSWKSCHVRIVYLKNATTSANLLW